MAEKLGVEVEREREKMWSKKRGGRGNLVDANEWGWGQRAREIVKKRVST